MTTWISTTSGVMRITMMIVSASKPMVIIHLTVTLKVDIGKTTKKLMHT